MITFAGGQALSSASTACGTRSREKLATAAALAVSAPSRSAQDEPCTRRGGSTAPDACAVRYRCSAGRWL